MPTGHQRHSGLVNAEPMCDSICCAQEQPPRHSLSDLPPLPSRRLQLLSQAEPQSSQNHESGTPRRIAEQARPSVTSGTSEPSRTIFPWQKARQAQWRKRSQVPTQLGGLISPYITSEASMHPYTIVSKPLGPTDAHKKLIKGTHPAWGADLTRAYVVPQHVVGRNKRSTGAVHPTQDGVRASHFTGIGSKGKRNIACGQEGNCMRRDNMMVQSPLALRSGS